jgi:hypothetical protein
MSFSFSDFAGALKAGAQISAEDVLAVRRFVWPDGSVSDDEAEVIFELNRLASDPGPEWKAFFIEAMCDYVVNARPPRGYVDDEASEWLIEQIGRGGTEAAKAVELELVVCLLEKALNAPAALKHWALGRIEVATAADGKVGDEESKQLRRILFASGGDGALSVSAGEAEALWRIKDACLKGDNCQGWKQLFCQAVGNHLMAFSSYRPLERSEAARLDAWVNDRSSSVLGFIGRMGGSLGDGLPVREAVDEAFREEQSAAEHDNEVDAARAIVPGERSWLNGHVEADGTRDEYEEALLAFVAEESGEDSKAA